MWTLLCLQIPRVSGRAGGEGVGFRGGEAARERGLFWEAGEGAAGLSFVLELFACEWVSGLFFFVSGRVLAAARDCGGGASLTARGETVQ